MENKGFTVCLLKHMLGEADAGREQIATQSANGKPICLGYFGRVDVEEVRQFSDKCAGTLRFGRNAPARFRPDEALPRRNTLCISRGSNEVWAEAGKEFVQR